MTHIWSSMSAAMRNCSHTVEAPFVWDPVNHLLSRASFGATPADRRYLGTHGPDAWYAMQVRLGKAQTGYGGNAAVAAACPLLKLDQVQLRNHLDAANDHFSWIAMDQLSQATIGLQAWSQAQLYEILVDFFANHLNVANHDGEVWLTRATYDRDVIRKHAMGSFTDMLLAAAKHPAMLIYLSLAKSTNKGINENYGRELLELHTVGLRYSQSDVTNTARMLTGRTIDDLQRYFFDPSIHSGGRIKVLGWESANSNPHQAEATGDSLLRYLAAHPYTARHLAHKLCVRLVADNPSSALIDAVAKAYTDNGTAILPMVSTILRSSEFWQSRGRKMRRPAENLVATVRTLGVRPANTALALQSLSWMTSEMGNRPLDWPAPNGYPDVAAAWRSSGTLLTLWRLQAGFAGGWWNGFAYQSVTDLWGDPGTVGEAIDGLTRRYTGMVWSADDRAAILNVFGDTANTPLAKSMIGKADGNRKALAGLLLHGPQHAMR